MEMCVRVCPYTVLDQEMNNGSLARPYHMTSSLRRTICRHLRKGIHRKKHKEKPRGFNYFYHRT